MNFYQKKYEKYKNKYISLKGSGMHLEEIGKVILKNYNENGTDYIAPIIIKYNSGETSLRIVVPAPKGMKCKEKTT